MVDIKKSPITLTLQLISRKWTIEIITDLMQGRKRFSDFLEAHAGLSSKMLSERLKELYNEGFVEKIVTNMMPLRVKYQITDQGRLLNRVLYEMALFGVMVYSDDVLGSQNLAPSEIIKLYAALYCIGENEAELRLQNPE
ncbi:MAG: winged helix-turn-helix transcriptional regulator [Candidatus Heimdallarchaeota archaeon]